MVELCFDLRFIFYSRKIVSHPGGVSGFSTRVAFLLISEL